MYIIKAVWMCSDNTIVLLWKWHNGPPNNTVNSYLLLTQVHFFVYLTYVLHLKNLIMQSSELFKSQHCNKILRTVLEI